VHARRCAARVSTQTTRVRKDQRVVLHLHSPQTRVQAIGSQWVGTDDAAVAAGAGGCGSRSPPISGTITRAGHQPASNVVIDLLPDGPGDIRGWGLKWSQLFCASDQ
jgi:hypothetical protein